MGEAGGRNSPAGTECGKSKAGLPGRTGLNFSFALKPCSKVAFFLNSGNQAE